MATGSFAIKSFLLILCCLFLGFLVIKRINGTDDVEFLRQRLLFYQNLGCEQKTTTGQPEKPQTTGDHQNLQHKQWTTMQRQPGQTHHTIHFIYNTGCDEYQLIQSIVVDHSWRSAGNKGRLTRIVTNCKPEDSFRENMTRSPLKDDPDFAVWFLEGDYGTIPSNGKKYGARARPISIDMWLREVKPSEPILAILEPDQLCMFPLSEHPGIGRIRPGRLIAQEYAYGGAWWSKFKEVDEEMPQIGWWVVQKNYTTGPPWVVHMDDVRRMLPDWIRYGDGIASLEQELYREQFAFMMAAAKHGIQNEPNIDGPRAGMRNNPLMVSNPADWPICSWDVEPQNPERWKPMVLHYCVSYAYQSWGLFKALVSDGWYAEKFSNRVPTINKCGAPFFQAMAAYRRIYCPEDVPKLVSDPPEGFGFMRTMQPYRCSSLSGTQTRYRVHGAQGSWATDSPLGGNRCSKEAQARHLPLAF